MAGATGLDAQFGLVEEVTYGTYLAPARFFLIHNETLALSLPRIESPGIGAGLRGDRTDQWMAGKRQAAGDVVMEVAGKQFGLLWKHLLGNIATVADGTGKKHTASVANLKGRFLGLQVGRPDVGNTVDPYSYKGSKITKCV